MWHNDTPTNTYAAISYESTNNIVYEVVLNTKARVTRAGYLNNGSGTAGFSSLDLTYFLCADISAIPIANDWTLSLEIFVADNIYLLAKPFLADFFLFKGVKDCSLERSLITEIC